MNKKRLVANLFLVLGILCTLSGIVLTIYSFKHEVIDEKYIVKEVTNYTPEKEELKKGEIKVVKSIDYMKKGEYDIQYELVYNREDIDTLLSNKSNFTITEELEDSYELKTKEILINKEPVRLYNYNTVTSDYKMSYKNNIFEISFPVQKIADYKTVKIHVVLKARDVNKKHNISKESYYSFVPNFNNDYYNKKTAQSYIIIGNAYILLEEKK